MKHALCFIAGIAVGVIAVFVYQVFGKPVEPKLPPGYEWLDLLDRFDEWDSASAHDWQGFERSLDDIQPIYTGGD